MSDQERENCHISVNQSPESGHGTVATETVYETMFDAVEDAVFLFDVERDGDALSFTFRRNNPAHEASSGMTVAEFGGQTPREIFGSEEGAEVGAHYQDCVEKRDTIEYEETLDHPSGTVEWHTKLTPVIEDGDVTKLVGVARDITDQKEREQALERQQQFTDDLLDAIDDVGYVLDRHGNLREWNASLESVTGYTSDEIESMNAMDFFAEEDSETVEQAVREAFETGHARMELDLLAADSEAIPYEFTANVFESPSGERVMAGIGRNRTRHVEYERELEAERDFLDTVIESVPFPFYVLNVDDYTIEYANSRAVVREGETCYVMTHDRDQPCDEGENPVACPREEIRALREPTVVEHTHYDENGNERCFQVHAAPIFDDEGEVAQIAESNIDITERIEYERRLEAQRDNLELLNQVVRHDIRNDLQLIQTYSELLEADIDEDRRQYVETVLESAENAVDLTTTARELAEVMLQSDSETHQVSLGRTLEQQVEEVRSGHSEAVVTVDGSLPRTTVGANDMLGSVFRNLLKNAIQHNDKTVPEVTVSAVEHDGYVEVRVADNGPGVPESQKQGIFGKGEKGLESEGTGIGLYLVQSLVDGYGGNVWVEDRVKDGDPAEDTEGAVFVVQLPIVE